MKIVVTSGEPAGIGPDLCALLSSSSFSSEIVVLGDARLIASRAAIHGCDISRLHIEDVQTPKAVMAGHLDVANARYVLDLLDRAVAGCQSGEYAAMVTAPVQKSVIANAGVAFTGHTEYLAEKTGAPFVVMMLVGGHDPLLRVALATIHIPLSAVPAAITRHRLIDTLHIVNHDLKKKFGITYPRILVAGLNPHAGESGHLGREENEIIEPVIRALQHEGMQVEGPLPADTLFTRKHLARADAVLAMYHDQGLPVLKHVSFGRGVNITLGLPIIRTSVDHGTALDLAGKRGAIDVGSMSAAIALAQDLAARRQPQ
ncbi:MAG: 4-hydroxythreonine-4-phosphate dehydrogenase PdxA [Rhodocyclaceae bacterium]|nr:4-hydroxythreonine-4-phosphate dehydrogenase PdxA [Rhodocyclaceae bacterium]